MAIFIDTANPTHAKRAKKFGWVRGITTNPLLLAQEKGDPAAILKELSDIGLGPVFYQLVATDAESMKAEANRAREIIGKDLVLKIPPTPTGFAVLGHLATEIPCCVTALFSGVQAAIACEAGARYVAIYVNRATRALGDGIALVRDIALILKEKETEIIAASIKSAEEANEALKAGADHLTASCDVLETLPCHDLSNKAIIQFSSEGTGIKF